MAQRALKLLRRFCAGLRRRPVPGPLEVRSERFQHLFPAGTKIERLATGFGFTEGPVWLSEQACLLFTDIPGDRILRLDAPGRVSVFRSPSHNANGLARDRQGRLIACEQGTRRVTRTEADGRIRVLADRYAGKPLNSPNDVVVRSDGSVFFTDPPYGISPAAQEQVCQGVYRLSPDDQVLTLVSDDFDRPNGLAFSPGERQLYIGDSARGHIRVFDVAPDGALAGGRVLCELRREGPGDPDGMKIDAQGRVYCTGPGGVWVFDADGTHLGTIVTPEVAANCAWGDADGRALYITARTSVYRVRTAST